MMETDTETKLYSKVVKINFSNYVNKNPSIMPCSNGLIRPHHSKLTTVYQIMDGICIVCSLLLLLWINGIEWNDHYSFLSVSAVSVFYLIAQSKDIYRSWRIASMQQEIVTVWLVWLEVILLLLLINFFISPPAIYTHHLMVIWYVATPILLTIFRVIWRNIWRYFRSCGHNSRRVAIIGVNEVGNQLAETIDKATWMGLRLLGFYDDRIANKEDRINKNPTVPLRGDMNVLSSEALKGDIDMVFITFPLRAETRINDIIGKLSDTTASVYVVPNFFTFDLLHMRWYNMGEIPVVSVCESPFYGVNGWVKRLEDLVLGSLMLLFFIIPMLFISLGIKLSSRGPIIFKQQRYGMDGREIKVWKFRTMTVCEDGDQVKQAKIFDPRITPFGRFLRKTSLDELPQIINVLQGTMSIVGPRPHAVAHNEEYRRLIPRYMLRHKVKPGITGLAQVNGWRGETDTLEKMQRRVECDLAYIRQWSLFLDLKIILITALKGFVNKNAY